MKRKISLISGAMAAAVFSTAVTANTTSDMEAVADQRAEQKIQEYVNSPEFDARVEEAIINFIQKQERKRAEQAQAQQNAKKQEKLAKAKFLPMPSEDDHIRGDSGAEFTLLTYNDYECPYCKRFHDYGKAFTEANEDVNWVIRHFPLSFHNPGAQEQSEAAECAGELGGSDAFWEYSDLIMERTSSGGTGFPIENLVPLAVEIGLDKEAFTECYESDRYEAKVKDQYQKGIRGGVTGTPGNFLVHNPTGTIEVIEGAQPPQMMERILEGMKVQLK
jgi:protein-disulfide isomerase